jgi:hypothetical protein
VDPPFYYAIKGGRKVKILVCILTTAFLYTVLRLALCVLANQHMRTQAEALFSFSFQYIIYG